MILNIFDIPEGRRNRENREFAYKTNGIHGILDPRGVARIIKMTEMLIKPVVSLAFWVARGSPDLHDPHKENQKLRTIGPGPAWLGAKHVLGKIKEIKRIKKIRKLRKSRN